MIADIINPLSKTPTRQSGRLLSGRPLRGLQRKVRNLASEGAGRSANKNNTVPGTTYCKPCTSYTLSYTLECKLRKSLKPIIRSALPGTCKQDVTTYEYAKKKRRDSAPQRVLNPYSMSQEEPDSNNNKTRQQQQQKVRCFARSSPSSYCRDFVGSKDNKHCAAS